MSNRFEKVRQEMEKARLERDVRYEQIRLDRFSELQELADIADISMDGRRTRRNRTSFWSAG